MLEVYDENEGIMEKNSEIEIEPEVEIEIELK